MNPFNTTDLSDAWNLRKSELQQEHLQKYADILYGRLAAMVDATRDEIHERMRERISTATKKADLNINLFTYNVRRGACTSLNCVCTATNGWNPTIAVEDELQPETLGRVINSTDICLRLSLLFGPNFWVSSRRTGNVTADMVCGCVRVECELALSYFPDGLRGYHLHALAALRERVAYVPRNRVIWWDDAPRTPPRPVSAAPPQPPPLIRLPHRSNVGGIYYYESVEDAARDTINECLRECYCFNPEDEE